MEEWKNLVWRTKHTREISMEVDWRFFLVKCLIVNEIWASARDNASRVIFLQMAGAVIDEKISKKSKDNEKHNRSISISLDGFPLNKSNRDENPVNCFKSIRLSCTIDWKYQWQIIPSFFNRIFSLQNVVIFSNTIIRKSQNGISLS